MRSWSCAVVLLACITVGWAEPGAPYLVVNPDGHVGAVERMAFSADGTRLISCGIDRVVRVWNVADGQVLRTIRVPAARAYGAVYNDHAMAVSPDCRHAAVVLGAPYGSLWIYDLGTGTLVQRIPVPAVTAASLQFSPRGSLIAVALDRGYVRIYEIASGRLVRELRGTADAICWSPKADQIAVYANGNTVGTLTVLPVAADGPAEQRAEAPVGPRSVAWSPDGRSIACSSWAEKTAAWDAADLSRRRAAPDVAGDLVYSADSRSLWAVSAMYDCQVQELDGSTLAARRVLPADFANARSLALHGNCLAVGLEGGEIQLWDTSAAHAVRCLRSPGTGIYYTGWSQDGQHLGWSNTRNVQYNLIPIGPMERAFDLANWVPGSCPASGWNQAVVKNEKANVERMGGPTSNSHVTVSRPGLDGIVLSASFIAKYSLLPDGRPLLAIEGGLQLFDQLGRLQRTFQGSPGMYRGLAVSPDGRYVVSGGEDQTLRIWPLEATDETVPPLLSFFLGDNGDWIAWTRQGYYACTPGAERWVAWQTDYPDRASELFPVYQFRQQFYRPDVIALVLKHSEVSKALAEADAQRGRPGTVTVAAPTVQAPPSVTILTPKDGATVTADETDLRAKVVDPGGRAIRRVHFTVNGRSIDGARFVFVPIRDEPGVWATRAPLSPGECTLSVVATNDVGAESLPASTKVTCQPAAEGPPPSLYVLAVGVGKYAKAEYSLKYAGADAIGLAEALRAGAGKLYQKVGLKVLSDDQATRAGVLDGLEWLSQQVTQRDLAVVFMAGHGVPDVRNDYQFLPFDGDVEKLISTGVKWTDIRAVLSKLPGRVILALDTCHSAGVTGARALGPRLDYTNLLREAATDEVGLVTLSSCMPHEVSLENEAWQHGAFTKAMIEALQGQADNNHDGIVSLAEVDAYVSERVKELTGGRQHPTSQRPATIRSSLPLALCDVAGK